MSIPEDDHIGEPGYPSPWTTSVPREGLRDTDAAVIVSLSPDVCKSRKRAVPYPVVEFCGHDEGYTPSVRFTGQSAMVLRSQTTDVHGDEAGRGGGVVSGTCGGICEPIGHAEQVFAEGSPVIRHLDRFHMNNRNTEGEAIFVRDMAVYAAPIDDDPLPGSLQARTVFIDGAEYQVADASGGTQYALAAQAAQPAPQPTPGSPPPRPTPAPRPPGDVIRPSPDRTPNWQWEQRPREPNRLERLGRFGRWVSRRALPLALLWPDAVADGTIPAWDHHAPQDDYEVWLNEEASRQFELNPSRRSEIEEDFYHQLESHRAERAEEDRQAGQATAADTARITQLRRQHDCLVGPYSAIRPLCPGEAHHLMPDFVLRYGNRAEGVAGQKRIPNAPSLAQGMTICLLRGEHVGVHGQLNQEIRNLSGTSPVWGTASIDRITDVVEASISRMPIPARCKTKAIAAMRLQMFPLAAQPGRTTTTLPHPGAVDVLRRGHY